MANTRYVSANRLTAEANRSRKYVLAVGAPVALIAAALFPQLWWLIAVLAILLFVPVFNSGSIKRAGAQGEDATLQVLSGLPDSYFILNQLMIPSREKRSGFAELDFVVVGPNGLFVIEVKNNNSRIVGSGEEGDWTIHKVGRGGTPYRSAMKNPVRQLKGQIWALANLLRERRHKAWIDGVLYFSNPRCELDVSGTPSVRVLRHRELNRYILGHRPKFPPGNPERIAEELASMR